MSLKKVLEEWLNILFCYLFPCDLTYFSIFVKLITCLKTLDLMTKPTQLITGSEFDSWDVSYGSSIYFSRKIRPQKNLVETLTNLTCISSSL